MSSPEPTSPNYLTSALTYAARGWRVLPLLTGSKRPALTRWPEQATTDPRQIADWWIDQPDRNIGLATGAGSGFFVLDIDPKNGGDDALAELVQTHNELPSTYRVRTGSGGWHHYFLCPDFEVTNSPGQLKGTGIDVRGEGGQVVAPPSVTGVGAYTVELAAPVAAAPAWLLDLIRPRPLTLVPTSDRIDVSDRPRLETYVARAVDHAYRDVAAASGGSRNQTLNDQVLALAGIAAHDPDLVPKDDLYRLMHGACGANGYLDDDGVGAFSATFESAWSAGLQKPRREWPPVDRDANLDFGPAAYVGSQAMPVVNVTSRKLNELTDEVTRHFIEANQRNPRLFSHGTELVQVVGPPATTATLDANLLAYEADVVMHFERTQPKGGTSVVNLPQKVAETILAQKHKPFPPLTRVAHAPFFSPSGRYVDQIGYDPESRTYYSPSLDMSVLPVPDEPTPQQVSAALAFIRTEVLHDFPFVSEAERAHALALMLLPFVRDLIDGPTPLHDIEAPTRGSGKDKLTRCLLTPGVGRRLEMVNAPAGEDEWVKSLFSYLRNTPQALVIGNLNAKLSSGSLCIALTEPEFSARVLGVSSSATVPVRSIFVVTANNPKFSDEVARRSIRIRLDAQVEHPENRGGWRHDDVVGWCADHRAELVQACCTMIQGWVRAGMPEPVLDHMLGSFERWHAVMGGLLDYLGVPGLLDNKAEFLAAGDDEADAWSTLVAYMRTDLAGEWSSSALAEIVTEQGIAIDLGRSENKALMMGRELAKQRDRWHSGHKIEKRMLNGKSLWRLVGKPIL